MNTYSFFQEFDELSVFSNQADYTPEDTAVLKADAKTWVIQFVAGQVPTVIVNGLHNEVFKLASRELISAIFSDEQQLNVRFGAKSE